MESVANFTVVIMFKTSRHASIFTKVSDLFLASVSVGKSM